LFLVLLANRNLGHSLVVSLRLRNPWVLRMFLGAFTLLGIVLALPWLRQVLGLSIPAPQAAWVIGAILVAGVVWIEALRVGRLHRLAR
jgi:P-type Ca2+ transporter type 2C